VVGHFLSEGFSSSCGGGFERVFFVVGVTYCFLAVLFICLFSCFIVEIIEF
jgi:hypothetical protein